MVEMAARLEVHLVEGRARLLEALVLRPQTLNLFAQRLQLKQVQLKLRALQLRQLAARIRSEIFVSGG